VGLREHPGDGLDGGAPTPTVSWQAGSDLGADLFGALSDGVRVVVCDLRTAPVSAAEVVEILRPVTRYLSDWPGAGMAVVCSADSEIRSALRSMTRPHTLVLSESADEGLDQLYPRLPPLQRRELHLAARMTSPRASRLFVARALLDWEYRSLVARASLVVSELVTNAVVHAASAVDVALSRADGRVQMLVSDQGAGHPEPRFDDPQYAVVGGRGLLLVNASTRAWGVFPASGGKTVWTVFDVPSRPNVV
jgi:anti-sigma regulatory factor (Ser/Thr protein kinase)